MRINLEKGYDHEIHQVCRKESGRTCMEMQVKMNSHMIAGKAERDRSCNPHSEAKALQRR